MLCVSLDNLSSTDNIHSSDGNIYRKGATCTYTSLMRGIFKRSKENDRVGSVFNARWNHGPLIWEKLVKVQRYLQMDLIAFSFSVLKKTVFRDSENTAAWFNMENSSSHVLFISGSNSINLLPVK